MKFIIQHINLLVLVVFFVSCNGQNKTPGQIAPVNPKIIADGQSKLTKTQGTDQYQNIHCSLQDKAGNLWFGTTGEGVYRYDGKSFHQFTVKEGLSNNKIWSMLEDTEGNIWFGTDEGISRYDGKVITRIPISLSDEFNSYPRTSHNSKPPEKNPVRCIFQDKSGKIWFGTDYGLYCYNAQKSSFSAMSREDIRFTRFLDNDSIINKNGLSLKSVQCMHEDENGNIWFGSGPMAFEGICMYDGKSLVNFKPKDEGWIRKITENKDRTLLFDTRHIGLIAYNGESFFDFSQPQNLRKELLSAILIDSKGNIWYGSDYTSNSDATTGGFWKFDGKSFIEFTKKDGLGNTAIWSLTEDKAGNIWIGTRNCGLYHYDGQIFTLFSE